MNPRTNSCKSMTGPTPWFPGFAAAKQQETSVRDSMVPCVEGSTAAHPKSKCPTPMVDVCLAQRRSFANRNRQSSIRCLRFYSRSKNICSQCDNFLDTIIRQRQDKEPATRSATFLLGTSRTVPNHRGACSSLDGTERKIEPRRSKAIQFGYSARCFQSFYWKILLTDSNLMSK